MVFVYIVLALRLIGLVEQFSILGIDSAEVVLTTVLRRTLRKHGGGLHLLLSMFLVYNNW